MSCTRFESEALPKLLLGEQLDPHFDSCADCRLARAEYNAISDALRHGDMDDGPGDIWAAALWETVRAHRPASTAEAPPAQRSAGEHAGQLPSNDGDLFDAWRAGETQAGRKVFERYFSGVRRFFVATVGSDDADALIQDTFLALLEISDRPIRSSFRAFVFGVARNVLRDHYRRKIQEREPFRDVTEQRRVQEPPLDFHATRFPQLRETSWLPETEAFQLMALLDALRGLPFADQELLGLYYWEDLSAIELAEVLGLSEASVRARLRRARDQLASRLLARAQEEPARAEALVRAVPDGELHTRLAGFGARLRATSSG